MALIARVLHSIQTGATRADGVTTAETHSEIKVQTEQAGNGEPGGKKWKSQRENPEKRTAGDEGSLLHNKLQLKVIFETLLKKNLTSIFDSALSASTRPCQLRMMEKLTVEVLEPDSSVHICYRISGK